MEGVCSRATCTHVGNDLAGSPGCFLMIKCKNQRVHFLGGGETSIYHTKSHP